MSLLDGLLTSLRPEILIYEMLGVALGMLFGIVPGLTASMGVAILTPLAFSLSPAAGLGMILGVYNAAMFGGGITAIILNTPGTPAAIATTFDGYPMHQQGRGGLALGINALGGLVGSTFGLLVLSIVAVPLAEFALRFGPPEYFALGVFGLSMMVSVSGTSVVRGLLVGLMGVLLATVGFDPILGYPRFTFGKTDLLSGIPFIPVMIGLFGVAEVLAQMRNWSRRERAARAPEAPQAGPRPLGRIWPTRGEWRRLLTPMGIGSVVGTFIGAIPGAGGDIASLVSWDLSKQASKKPEEFGKGSIEGLAASETANNSVIGGAMATMLALGIPGDAPTAILIGTLLIWGLQPGPLFFRDHLDLFHVIVGTLLVSTVLSFIVSVIRAQGLVTWITRLSRPRLWTVVLTACVVGTYALNNSVFDVWVMILFGAVGVWMREFDLPAGPVVLGLVLGPMTESNLRRSLILSDGSWAVFVQRPIALILLLAAVAGIVIAEIQRHRVQKVTARQSSAAGTAG